MQNGGETGIRCSRIMIKVKIVGAGGYGGVGMVELLRNHPEASLVALVDVADVGRPYSALYPHLSGWVDYPIVAPDDPRAQAPADIVFFATPDRVGMKLAPEALAAGAKVIDYSGDFRFESPEAYADYAGRLGLDTTHTSPELLGETVYGLPELRRKQITPDRRLVGNPGCFAVSCLLGLAPAIAADLVETSGIICDCKTGVSGAGKKPAAGFHYPARYENMNAYRLAGHQHVCEIERELSRLAGTSVKVTFTPQVVPMCRGILSTLYARLKKELRREDAVEVYREFHRDNIFVRVLERDAAVGTVHVRGTNYCNLVVDVDERTGMLRVVSHIDNLMKGQAGNALQNMNLLFGLPEQMGLDHPHRYP